jgi:hypothetical protein
MERYQAKAEQARRLTGAELSREFGVDFHLTHWTVKAADAYAGQWLLRHPEAVRWDWPEMFRRHRNDDRLDMVIWGPGDRLSGLSLAVTTGDAVEIRFLEGDNRLDCPLRGRRIPIALDCAARYAQGRNKWELRVRPLNSALESLYQGTYGFEAVTGKPGGPYWARRIT